MKTEQATQVSQTSIWNQVCSVGKRALAYGSRAITPITPQLNREKTILIALGTNVVLADLIKHKAINNEAIIYSNVALGAFLLGIGIITELRDKGPRKFVRDVTINSAMNVAATAVFIASLPLIGKLLSQAEGFVNEIRKSENFITA